MIKRIINNKFYLIKAKCLVLQDLTLLNFYLKIVNPLLSMKMIQLKFKNFNLIILIKIFKILLGN